MSHDMRVLMVKLADRLHNMRTLDFQKAHKQKRIAQETMDIYAPLANRLGLYMLKRNLEDLSFKYLRPDVFNQIDHWLDKHQVVEKHIIDKVVALILDLLASNDIIGQVYGRIKHKYSIYKKMQSQSLTLDEMHDIMAFRVLVKDIRDCYAVLGLVHSQWRPVHGRFKDYISMPKANGYQSLHTTVIGPDGERIEIQIRTEDMHRQAEHGVAAHWLYKEKGRVNSKDLEQFSWLREIFERQGDETDSREFMHALKMDLFKDEVYVYPPPATSRNCPKGYASGLRLSDPYQRGPALRRGQDQRAAHASGHGAEKRRYGGDRHGPGAQSQPGLAQDSQDSAGPQPYSALSAHRRTQLMPWPWAATCWKKKAARSALTWARPSRKGIWPWWPRR